MNSAICLKCGMPKTGPLVPCPKCRHTPEDPKDQEAHVRCAHEMASRKGQWRWRVDLGDVIMNAIQIIGMAGTSVLLKRFTLLPFWVCLIIGIPLFWTLFMATVYLAFRGRRVGK